MLPIIASLSFLGYFLISLQAGPLFFLAERGQINFGLLTTLWRWTFAFGIIFAVLKKSYFYMFYFSIFIAMYTIAGDRTMLAIILGAIILVSASFQKRKHAFPSIKIALAGISTFFVLIFLKPIYLFIKTPSIEAMSSFLNVEIIVQTLQSFEPFITFSLLEMTVSQNIRIDAICFLSSILNNLLILPSFFGADTNYFNEYMTNQMPDGLSFGIAGNYLASGVAAFGIVGAVIFSGLYVTILCTLQNMLPERRSVLTVSIYLIGAVFAVYAHRNGLDNFLSFVRQIAVVGILIYVCYTVAKQLSRKGSPGQNGS